ncbi:MAG: aspartate aminotransferase family protein [Acidimicrobiales bacterium]|nr:aspartate aminotransferase family protein [Acidimicrobiales bacterium]
MPNPLFVADDELASLIFEYCRGRLNLDPVPLDLTGDKRRLEEALAGLITPEGNDPARVLDIFAEKLAPAVISCDSPRFLAFIPAAPSKAALLFDMVVSASSLQGTSWLEAAGAVAAENQALGVIAAQAGMPAGAGGCFVSGGSAGNLSALVVAREVGYRRFAPDRPARLRVAVSTQAHSSITKALTVIGVEPFAVPTAGDRFTGADLEAALRSDPEEGDVVAVVATAGTTNAGIIDDLAGIAAVAERKNLWFHVDAAYGGAALFAPSVRDRFAGIEHADSLVVDPHKWLFAPFDCASLIYRNPHLARTVHAQDAGYLDVIHTDAPEEWNPSDYAYHLTRRARGLPLWFSLAVHGTDAYRDAVESGLRVARQAADLIRRTRGLTLLRQPDLSIVLFRRDGWAPADYDGWSKRLLAEQIGFVTPTKWQGDTVARFAFLHPETTIGMVAEILATM